MAVPTVAIDEEELSAPSGEESPSKRKREDELAVHPEARPDDGGELVPAWVSGLQASFSAGFREMKSMMGDYNTRLLALEARAEDPTRDPRVDGLAEKVDKLHQLVMEGRSEAKTSSSTKQRLGQDTATDPWSQYLTGRSHGRNSGAPLPAQSAPSFTSSAEETDHCHVVVGGWPFDTSKRVIMSDMEGLVRGFEPCHSQSIERMVVFGQRAQVGHIFLSSLPPGESAERFYIMQNKYSNQRATAMGPLMWMAPSRTPARRQKNRITRKAQECLASIWGEAPKPEMEIGWSRQIIWIGTRRVAAAALQDLYATECETVTSKVLGEGEHTRFHFNLTALGGVTGKEAADVTIKLQEFQA